MSSSPFRIQDFWTVATPGTTLCLLDGTYQGAASMIAPSTQGAPAGFGGTSGRPITIRALNDGGAVLDGQFARTPVYLVDNSWFVVEGLNAKNGSGNVIRIQRGGNHIVRRVVAWDSPITVNTGPVLLYGTSNVLLEDVAVFGTGRDMIHNQSSTGLVYRRIWARWEGSTVGNYKRVINLSYDNNPGAICENCLATWSAESQPHTWTATGRGHGIVEGAQYTNWQVWAPGWLIGYGNPSTTTTAIGGRVYGSVAYMMPAASGEPSARGSDHPGWGLLKGRLSSDVRFIHSIAFVSPSHAKFASIPGLDYTTDASTTGILFDHVTAVRSSDRLGAGVQVTKSLRTTTLTINPWTNGADGANICKRWVNGQVTTEPLWPWPMNDRIKAATASAGAYQGPCLNCIGGRLTRKPTDVTADIQRLFGPIASECLK